MWADIDLNGNGFVSLSEVTTGIRDVLKLPEVYDSKLAIITAFNFSKSKCKTTRSHGDDYLEFNEFRFFLQTLRQFFEYYQAFTSLDSGNDGKISKDEFLSDDVKNILDKWTESCDDLESEFSRMDTNGGGQIMFSEFVLWALEKNIDFEE